MMKRKWIVLALVLIVPAMLFTVSCAKKNRFHGTFDHRHGWR